MPNPALQERVFRNYCAEMTSDEDSVHFDLRVTPAEIMHTIMEKWSNEKIAAFAWSMLHHGSFDCHDTFVQFAHAMVKELELPVDILQLCNEREQAEGRLQRTDLAEVSTYRSSAAHPNKSNPVKSEEPERTVSMTWWDCPVCQASKGVPIVELTKAGVPHCSNCTKQEMMQSSWIKAQQVVEYQCPGCLVKQLIPRQQVKADMVCTQEHNCDCEEPMELLVG